MMFKNLRCQDQTQNNETFLHLSLGRHVAIDIFDSALTEWHSISFNKHSFDWPLFLPPPILTITGVKQFDHYKVTS